MTYCVTVQRHRIKVCMNYTWPIGQHWHLRNMAYRNITLFWTSMRFFPQAETFRILGTFQIRHSISITLTHSWFLSEYETKANMKVGVDSRSLPPVFPSLFHPRGKPSCSRKSNVPAEAPNYLWSWPEIVSTARRVYQVAFCCLSFIKYLWSINHQTRQHRRR